MTVDHAADANGHIGTDTGQSCPAGWHELHLFLDHYQGAACSRPGPPAMERGDGDLGRLGGRVHRPDRVRRQAGRAVDQLRLRLGDSGSRGVPR